MKIAAKSNGNAAVAVVEINNKLYLHKYAPSNIGKPECAALFVSLFEQAASKLMWKRDKRFLGGWKKIVHK